MSRGQHRRPSRPARPAVRVARLVAGWGLCAIALLVTWPAQFGGHLGYTVVSGHSMEPLLHTGDLVLTWSAPTYRVGQLVTYTIPAGQPGAGGHVVHRLVGRRDGAYVTQGDNRAYPDIWHPADADIVGHEVLRVPNGGWVLVYLRSPLVLAALCGLLVAAALLKEPTPQTPEPRTTRAASTADC